jgi:hypothetical protein
MKINGGGNVWICEWITYSSVSPDFFAGFLQINDEGACMNSNLDKFFRGVGEGYLQSSAREMRHRDVGFAGPRP